MSLKELPIRRYASRAMNDPQPMSPAALAAELKQRFGFDSFRPGQQEIVRDILRDRDVLAIMPTGGGKSLCFQLPALLRPGVCIVISPLIALMQDQVRLLQDNGIEATFINSSLERAEVSRAARAPRARRAQAAVRGARAVAAGRVRRRRPAAAAGHARHFRRWSSTRRIAFRTGVMTSVRSIASSIACARGFPTCRSPRSPPRPPNGSGRTSCKQLALREPRIHVASFNRPNLYYAVRPKTRTTYAEVLEHARRDDGAGIVYCLSRKRVDELAERLQGDGIRALPYHAGLDANTRRDNQDAFIRDDAQVIVATIAFGMGINKPDVRWVVHYDLPKTLEGYYQESGRAGRDGERARCILYFGAGDIRTAELIIAQKVDPVSLRAAGGRTAHRPAAVAAGIELRGVRRVPPRSAAALLRRGVFRQVRCLRQLPGAAGDDRSHDRGEAVPVVHRAARATA